MSKRTRQYIGVLFAIVAYYIVHEGAHLIVALALHAFKKINFMGIGIQIDIYRDRLTGKSLIHNDGTIQIPAQAIKEYCIVDEGKVYLNGEIPLF